MSDEHRIHLECLEDFSDWVRSLQRDRPNRRRMRQLDALAYAIDLMRGQAEAK